MLFDPPAPPRRLKMQDAMILLRADTHSSQVSHWDAASQEARQADVALARGRRMDHRMTTNG